MVNSNMLLVKLKDLKVGLIKVFEIVSVGKGAGEREGFGAGVLAGNGVLVGVGAGEIEGFAEGSFCIPRFQTSRLPCLIQVKVFPAVT